MKLCEWIRYQATNVSRPTMKQVVEKAKLLTKSRRFRGSTGWCYQFILRHPFIKDCINRAGSRLESPPKTPQQELE